MRIAVVGGGIMGSCSALSLSRRGHSVVLFEQFEFGHDRGSSHGESRIVRRAYPDSYYTRLMTEAYPLWFELGSDLVNECGLLYIGERASMGVCQMQEALAGQGVAYTLLESSGEGCPFARRAGEVGVHSKEAGTVRADLALREIWSRCQELGVEFRSGSPVRREELEGFDDIVVAAGSWTLDWVPDLALSVSPQTYVTFDALFEGGPVWITDAAPQLYGFPALNGRMKIGLHEPDYSPEDAVAVIREFVQERFGGEMAHLNVHSCLYTMTRDEDFRWGRGDGFWYVSACSGHGFKFGPWIGERMADFVDGVQLPEDWPRFR